MQHDWQIPSPCEGNGGNCVEVDIQPGAVYVRDSKLGDDSPIHQFDFAEWEAFIKAVKAGQFDLPTS